MLVFVPNFEADVEDFLYWRERSGGGGSRSWGAYGGEGEGVELLSTFFIHYAWQLLAARDTDKIPTSGFLGLLWALEACDQVDTYGSIR